VGRGRHPLPEIIRSWTLSVISITEPSDPEYRSLKKDGDNGVPLSPWILSVIDCEKQQSRSRGVDVQTNRRPKPPIYLHFYD
jgi:hypothetical protein